MQDQRFQANSFFARTPPPTGGSRAAFFIIFIFFFFFLLLCNHAHANYELSKEVLTINQVESGSLLIESTTHDQYYLAPTIETDVDMDINGLIARVNVTQHFFNPSKEWVNGIYVFPLPENAAVDHMKLIIGERIIEGKIKERKQAKQIYEKAKHEGKKASLLEQERTNIFTNSVANIGPNEKVSVSIQYQQTLNYDQGQFSIRFPMVVGIRYIPGEKNIEGFSGTGWARSTSEVPDANRITPPVTEPEEGHSNPVSINIALNAGFPLENLASSYHTINKQLIEPGRYRIELIGATTSTNRDFELTWQPQKTLNHKPLFSHKIKSMIVMHY